jgi:hypothetical protein
MPPVQPIEDWARFKLGLGEDEARSAAFLIARKISREGTKGAHMFSKAIAANEDQVLRMFEKAAERISERVTV